MKKMFFVWLLVTILIACTEKHEPTLQEIVTGVYDIQSWDTFDTITGTGGGRGCTNSYLVIRENQNGLLDIESTCRVGIDIRDTRNINGFSIRESLQKTLPWINNADILYELYKPSTNTMAGVFYQYPSSSSLNLLVRARTMQGDTAIITATKRVE